MLFGRRTGAPLLVALLQSPLVAAQAPPPGAVPSQTAPNRLQVGLLLQTDGRFAPGDADDEYIDTFTFRRIRPTLQGSVAGVFDFQFTPDFAGGAVNIRDAYVDTRLSPAWRVRVGKAKAPFGLERLHAAATLAFVERALPTAVAPDRDVGLQLVGTVAGVVDVQAGLFNGVADGASAELDADDAKDLVGRVMLRPFARTAWRRLQGLSLAVAGSRGRHTGTMPAFRTSGQRTFFAYEAAEADGVRTRFSPQVSYYHRSVGIFGEYIRSSGAVRTAAGSSAITHEALVIAGTVLLTGESASDHGVQPRRPFDPAAGGWGALELAIRYHAFDVTPSSTAAAVAVDGASPGARAFTVGANWYINSYVKWVVNVDRTTIDCAPGRVGCDELLIFVRQQLSF